MAEPLYLSGPRWRIGDPSNPTEEDKQVHSEFEAIEEAQRLSSDDYQRPIAVLGHDQQQHRSLVFVWSAIQKRLTRRERQGEKER